jgi:hypothetical protein
MSISDPTSIRDLITPDIPTSSVKYSLKWIVLCMVLYYHGLPLSFIGNWLHVHKTTVLRWILDKVKGNIVYIKEKGDEEDTSDGR